MISLNQVIKNLNNIADAHYQINSFGSGNVAEFATSGTTQYPAMWVDYEPSLVQNREYIHVLRVYVCDRLLKGRRNELELLSDVQQICLDIIAQVQSNVYGWKLLSDNINLFPFSEPKMDDEDAGYYFDLRLKIPFEYNRCQIPSSTINTSQYPTSSGGSGTIQVYVDGVLVQTLTSNNLNAETITITWS